MHNQPSPRRPTSRRSQCLGLIGAAVVLALTGCALPSQPDRAALARINAPYTDCPTLITSLDRAAQAAGTNDAGTTKIAGFPHLRTDRFAAALARQLQATKPTPAMLNQWHGYVAGLGLTGLTIEAANTPGLTARQATARALNDCFDHPSPTPAEIWPAVAAARVPDDYITGQRVLGLYPLVAPLITLGFEKWKRANLTNFADHPTTTGPAQRRQTYRPPNTGQRLNSNQVRQLLMAASANPLHIALPATAELDQLFATFAPVFKVHIRSSDDHIATPRMMGPAGPVLDAQAATVFQRTSHAFFDGQPVLQLVYQVWFPARPVRNGVFLLGDILAGRLDGIIWRVTLGQDGRVIAYDSIHPCGCYHLFFPTPSVRLKSVRIEPGEGTLVPAPGPVADPGLRTVIELAADSHYLTAVYAAPEPAQGTVYRLAPMAGLRSLARPATIAPDQRRQSLYGPNGIVAGTERRERFLLWPAGIESPGAMRQWGRHPTAFVGRRHFDDPNLFKDLFERLARSVP